MRYSMRTQLIKIRLPEISYGISWQASEVLVRFYMESYGRQLKFSKKTLAAKLLIYVSKALLRYLEC